jgi:hypothetical protein
LLLLTLSDKCVTLLPALLSVTPLLEPDEGTTKQQQSADDAKENDGNQFPLWVGGDSIDEDSDLLDVEIIHKVDVNDLCV